MSRIVFPVPKVNHDMQKLIHIRRKKFTHVVIDTYREGNPAKLNGAGGSEISTENLKTKTAVICPPIHIWLVQLWI